LLLPEKQRPKLFKPGLAVKKQLGLTSWRRSPSGKIMPSDVVIAKNYLDKKEMIELNRIVNMYLDYAEMQAARGRTMTMKDWIKKLNAFLKFSEHELLTNAGNVSHEVAEELALKEYGKYTFDTRQKLCFRF